MVQRNIILALFFTVISVFSQSKKNGYEVKSPNGQNNIKFELVKSEPKYAVSHSKTEVFSLLDI